MGKWMLLSAVFCLSACADGQSGDVAVPCGCDRGSGGSAGGNSQIVLELENRCLNHRVDMLVALVAIAGLIGVFAPSFLYARSQSALHQAIKVGKAAAAAVRRSRSLLSMQCVQLGKQHYVHAKQCKAQLVALGALHGENPSGEAAVAALEAMRINFFVQMIIAIGNAVAYNFHAAYREGLVADLHELCRCVKLVGSLEREGEIGEIRRRLQHFVWAVSPDELHGFLMGGGGDKTEAEMLLGAYADVVSKFGRLGGCREKGEWCDEADDSE